MPKIKKDVSIETKEELKEILIDEEEKVGGDPELIAGDLATDEDEDDESAITDEEVNPFGDRWEE